MLRGEGGGGSVSYQFSLVATQAAQSGVQVLIENFSDTSRQAGKSGLSFR